jgi:RimJ/RimL family protein N-acetyltransferase
MQSARLNYERLSMPALASFHDLIQDDHVRRYLMDGGRFTLSWSEERIRQSEELFGRRGVGLWLAREREASTPIGFCGFLEFPTMHPEPQLVYALYERFTNRGYASEMARTSIAEARRHPGFEAIVAGVDAVNGASVHVLEKLGFRRVQTLQGAFGDMFLMVLED